MLHNAFAAEKSIYNKGLGLGILVIVTVGNDLQLNQHTKQNIISAVLFMQDHSRAGYLKYFNLLTKPKIPELLAKYIVTFAMFDCYFFQGLFCNQTLIKY